MTAPITYDHEAMNRRAAAVMDFLDLNLEEWEAWIRGDAPDRLPAELHPPIVSIIESLRSDPTNPASEARGDYLQALSTLSSDVLEMLRREVRPT